MRTYGGALLNSFLDRELCVAGRLTVLEGGELKDRLVRTGPIARIPQLAPHLDHKRNELVLDKQFNMYPVWGVDPAENDVLGYMAKHVIDSEPVDPKTLWVTTCCSLIRSLRAASVPIRSCSLPAAWITCLRCMRV